MTNAHLARLLSVLVFMFTSLLALAAAAQQPAPGAAAVSPEFRAAFEDEKEAFLDAARRSNDRSQGNRGQQALEAIRTRLAAKLKRPLTQQEQMMIQVVYAMAASQAAMAASPVQALIQGPPSDVARALESEREAIAAAGKKSFKDAEAPMQQIIARVAARTHRSTNDPALYGAVLQAVQAVRVTAAYAPGGSVYNRLPAAFQAGVDGSFGRDLISLLKADELLEAGKVDEVVALVRRNFAQADALTSPVFITATAAQGMQVAGWMDLQVDVAQRVASRAPNNALAVETGFSAAALRKAKGLDTERRISTAIASSTDPAMRNAYGAWRANRSALAQLDFQRAYGIPATPEQEQELTQLHAQAGSLERALAVGSKGARSADAAFGIDNVIPALRKTLAPGERLLSYVRYGTATSTQYAAYVLDAQKLTFVDLGPASAIDDAANAYLDALDRLGGDPASLKTKLSLARSLHALCFAPLESALGGSSAVRVAADGVLQLVPFAALHDGKEWVLPRYPFSYVNSERDALGFRAPVQVQKPPVVIAWSPPLADPPKPDPKTGKPLRPEDFPALPGVAREAQLIGKLLPKSIVVSGPNVSDWQLQSVAGPSILHIAAHGTFLDDGAASVVPAGGSRGIALAPMAGGKAMPSAPPAADPNARGAVDPLVRSALVLSPNASPATDGFLTAFEVAAMNMLGTELTVLSACETGRGGPNRISGVRGLRAAFFAAGAQALVVSLWKVRTDPDVKKDPTVNLMQNLYENLAKRQGRRDALQNAMLAARTRNADPSTWAPFILLGATGPLLTFGAVPAAAPATVADESGAARVARAAAFRALERGRTNGSGEWQAGTAKDSLLDFEVQGGLGPRQNNLKINLVGSRTLIAFFIQGYRSGATYRLGSSAAQAGLMFKPATVDVDAGSLDLNGNQLGRVSDGTLTLRGGGETPLSGTFNLRLGERAIEGRFEVPGDF